MRYFLIKISNLTEDTDPSIEPDMILISTADNESLKAGEGVYHPSLHAVDRGESEHFDLYVQVSSEEIAFRSTGKKTCRGTWTASIKKKAVGEAKFLMRRIKLHFRNKQLLQTYILLTSIPLDRKL